MGGYYGLYIGTKQSVPHQTGYCFETQQLTLLSAFDFLAITWQKHAKSCNTPHLLRCQWPHNPASAAACCEDNHAARCAASRTAATSSPWPLGSTFSNTC